MATVQMPIKYQPLKKPTEPGFYFIAEAGEQPHLVKVCVENDSHDMYYVLLPDEDYKYHIALWDGALWFGPVEEDDFELFRQE